MVLCNLTPLQKSIYESFVNSDTIRRSLKNEGGAKMTSSSLAAITSLKKLVNHPDLIFELCKSKKEGFENALDCYPKNYDGGSGRLQPGLSGKLAILDVLLASVKGTTSDKVVLVSNYTQTLDLFERLSRLRNYAYVR